MESRYTIHILPSEWRWVIVVATLLVLLAFVPFLWVALSNTGDWQFMGALHNYQDTASYFSKMLQGEAGSWLIRFQHTPENYLGALLQVLYPALGHLSRLVGLPVIATFHVARVGASLFMYLAFYYLAASIWQRVRTRRLFFAVVALGSGLGWLVRGDGPIWPDLQMPEMFGLYSTFANVHFPLTLGCLALLASLLIQAFRPGTSDRDNLRSGLWTVGLLSVVLALLYPQALVPLGAAAALYVVWLWLMERRHAQINWLLPWVVALIIPAVPLALYYSALVTNNPFFAEWNRQNQTLAPTPLALVLGLGLPLLIALPALFRAVRRFEQVDDRLFLLWLVAMIVLMYLPTNIQRRFAVGMMIPVAYFATRALEEFWLQRVSRRYRGYVMAVLVPLMVVSHIFVLFIPLMAGFGERSEGLFLQRDYAQVFRWLNANTEPEDVILAAPVVGTWLPGWANARVVYGHPYETLDAERKLEQVKTWYQADTDCDALLAEYEIRYVIVGPQERLLGPVGCADGLTEIATQGQVTIYAP